MAEHNTLEDKNASSTPVDEEPEEHAVYGLRITSGVIKWVDMKEVAEGIRLHVAHHWGEISFDQQKKNELALIYGGRLQSRFMSAIKMPFYVTSSTTDPTPSVHLKGEEI